MGTSLVLPSGFFTVRRLKSLFLRRSGVTAFMRRPSMLTGSARTLGYA
jgi:hypothetical protein